MILGFKTKNEKEIDRLNELVNTLTINDVKVSSENDKLKDINKKLEEQVKQLKEENLKSFNVIKKLTLKIEKIEKARHKNASALGGCKKQIRIVKEKLDYSNNLINQFRQLIEKREKDYLFVLKLLFNKVKFEKHSRDYLRIKMKEYEAKYPNEISSERKSKDVSNCTK